MSDTTTNTSVPDVPAPTVGFGHPEFHYVTHGTVVGDGTRFLVELADWAARYLEQRALPVRTPAPAPAHPATA